MNQIALIGGSLAAIVLLALVARLLRLGGARLDAEIDAREIAEATFADFEADRTWLDSNGASAVVAGKDGSHALVRRHGARFIARKLVRPAKAQADGPVVVIASGERLLKPFVITLASGEDARLLTSMLGSIGDVSPDPVDYAIPAFVLLVLAEMLVAWARDRRRYCPRDTLTSLALGLGSTIAGLLTAGAVFAMAMWLWQFRLFDIGYAWYWFVLAFVIDDLAYYAFHRSAHRVRWFWASHVIHHSSQHYNLSTALRQTWTGFISVNFLFRVPLFLIGFPPAMVFFVGGLNLIYQFWIHTEAIGRMPRWFEAVMNTPSHHRVHHATNPRYLDKNYAGVFIVWDKWFGTYTPERDDDRPRYGIVKDLGSFNILWAATHEWVGIAKDVWRAPGWGARLRYMFAPPGWSHDDSRDTSEKIKAHWEARQERGATWKKSTSSSSEGDRAEAPQPAG